MKGEATVISSGDPGGEYAIFKTRLTLEVKVPGWEPYRSESTHTTTRTW